MSIWLLWLLLTSATRERKQRADPCPAFVIDRHWNLLLTNNAATQLLATFINPTELQTHFYQAGGINLIRVLFHPQGLRPFIANWEKLAERLLQRVQREAMTEDEQSTMLLNELMSYPGINELRQPSKQLAQDALLLTTHFKREHLEWQFFSTIATLGTPYDITLQELRIECLFPADETTERDWKQNEDER